MRVDRLPLDCGPALTAKLAIAVGTGEREREEEERVGGDAPPPHPFRHRPLPLSPPTPPVEAALLHGPGLPLPPSDADAAEGALLARVADDAAVRTATGSQLSASRRARFPLALPPLDALLGGGLRVGVITELFGAPAAGKTAVCAVAAARAVVGGGCVLWLASPPSSFPAARVAALVDMTLAHAEPDARARRAGVAAALERVSVLPAEDGRAAAAALDAGLAAAAAASTPPTLIILDSAASALDGTLGGNTAGAGVASSLARALKAAAAWAHAPAITTVHELSGGGGWGRPAGPPRPALGEGWRPHAATRVRLAADDGAPSGRHVATVTVGPRTGESVAFDL